MFRMRICRRRCRRTQGLFLAAAAVATLAAAAAPAHAADLLRDDFDGASLDGAKWDIGTWQLGRTQLGFTPQLTQGLAKLRLDTYNPTNTSLLRGTEILSDKSFARGSGMEYEARVRTNPLALGGAVTSFFTYTAAPGSPPLADEIDFEWLSNAINASPGAGSDPVLATTWNNFRTDGSNFDDPNVHSSVSIDVPNLNLSTFNTFKIRWLPDRVQWYVNDVPIRTARIAVPDAPAPIRANFWAPGGEWPDAFSGNLKPVNNAGANTSYLYDVDYIAVRRMFSGVAATGPGRVITDTFRNGSVANSDAITNLWSERSQGSGSAVTDTAPNVDEPGLDEPLKLRAAGAGFPHAQIATGVRSEFNFFKTPVAIEAAGIGFSSTSNSTTVNTISKSILRFSLSSSTLGNGTQSEYTVADALSLRIEGTNLVAFGYKVNSPNANSEYNVNFLSQPVSGPVRAIKMIVHGSFYRLDVVHDVSDSDSTQTTSNFSGALSLNLADWSASGDMAMFIQGQLNNSGANENMTALLDSLAISAVRPTWTPAGSASWNGAANWDWQLVPNYRGADARFTNPALTPQSISLGAPVTVGSITFDSAQAHTITATGPGAITFDAYLGDSRIDALSGAHTINAPITLLRPLTINAAGGTSLKLTGSFTANGQTITKDGTGEAEISNVRTGLLVVNDGRLKITASGGAASGASKVSSVRIAVSARLDLRDNKLISNTAAGTATNFIYSGLQGQVQRAYDSQSWDQPGLTTSMPAAQTGLTTIAVSTGAAMRGLGAGETDTFAGQIITGASTVAMYTYAGDANLDGTIDGGDYGVIDNNVQVAGESG
jgi:beta-glucanase (GH16 family)